MVTCQICGYKHDFMIAPNHIKKHGMTTQEYKEKYPGSVLRIQTKDTKEKISNSKQGKENDKLKNRIFSEEHRQKISRSLKKGFSSGGIIHWNTGNHWSEETKFKISQSNQITRNIGNERQHLKKIDRIIEGAKLFNCLIIEIKEITAIAKCLSCSHEFEYTHQIFYPERLSLSNKLCPVCNPRETFSSTGEREIVDFLKSIYDGIIITNDREQLGGKEIDIFIPELNIGIEFTGIYWHAEKQNTNNKHLLWKQEFASKQGIKLITIFDDEWNNKQFIVKSRVSAILNKNQIKIFGRKCNVQIIDSCAKKQFLENNHIQGNDQPKLSLGLFYNDKLISVMTFKMTNMIKGGDGKQWELSRFCSLCNHQILGGASKLLKYFKEHYQNDIPIISYADRRWSTGDLYKTLGFEFVHYSSPSYWYTKDYKNRHHRSKFMKHKIISKFDSNPSKSEWEIMKENGYDRIWDCGTSKWIMK